MSLSFSQTKLLVILVAFACVFSTGSEAWSWSWSSGSGSGSGWESHGSDGSASGSGTNPDGSHWSWRWDTRSGWRWRADSNNTKPGSSNHNVTKPEGSSNHNVTKRGSSNHDVTKPGSSNHNHNVTMPGSSHHNHNETKPGSSKHNDSRSGSDDNDSRNPVFATPREVVVGGSRGWNYGVDLEEWASKTTFHVGDVLVFEYYNMTNRRHDVYLQTNLWSYRTCNFESRNKIASSEENRSKESFQFTLAMSQPYSFACGENNSYYCRTYNMKFSVLPGA
uniref:Phytocyanin domain-containing protein n=1 Tax=Brassica oleracea var. oleracea TaxID=109376 RepID=A0A0D3CVN6_BRAOL